MASGRGFAGQSARPPRRCRAGVDIGGAQLGRQQMPAAEHVQRQIAVAVVIAVKEAALLMPVQRVVGGVERSRMICSGGRLCASRNSVTGSASIAAASSAILW